MPNKHVWIALPAYTGQIHLGTMRSIITDTLKLAERGDRVTIFDESGNAMIADCRSLIVAKFLEGDGTDLVFVDTDVVWEAGALVKLVDAPVDFVAAIYPQRVDPINFCFQLIMDRPELWANPETGLLEVAGVPAGFMRLGRAMLERMSARYVDLEFRCDAAPNGKALDLFGAYWEGGLKYGEDYSFCRRWRDMGGAIWVDPEIRMGHVGYKTFMGSWGDSLRERSQKQQLQQLETMVEAMERAA